MWCCLLARAVLQRTQHFGLEMPTGAWLHHAARSRPAESRKKPGRRLIDIRDGRKLLRMSTILLRSSPSSDHLFWCRKPQRRFTDMFRVASVLIAVGEKLFPSCCTFRQALTPNALRSWLYFFTATAPISPKTCTTASKCRCERGAGSAAILPSMPPI